jgi:hypothetical protein
LRTLTTRTIARLAVGLAIASSVTAIATPAAAAAPQACRKATAQALAQDAGILGSRSFSATSTFGGKFTGRLDWAPDFSNADLSEGRLSDPSSVQSYSYGEMRYEKGRDNCQGGVQWDNYFRYYRVGTANNGQTLYPLSWSEGPYVRQVHFQVCTYRQTSPAGWSCSGWK